jgi:hypothetical protein
MTAENLPTIRAARATAPHALALAWSNGTEVTLNLAPLLETAGLAPLQDPAVFAAVTVGDWGHSLAWPGEIELGADSLWHETLTATGRADTRAFLEWRLRHGLSLAKAAEALGLARRTVAYYSSGQRPIPKAILLACRGWETDSMPHAA